MTATAAPTGRITVCGPFDLAASARFLAGFTPAGRPDAAGESGVLRLAFPVDEGGTSVGAVIRQRAPGTVEVEAYGPPGLAEAVTAQVRRILSLDVDGTGFAGAGERDPVVGALQRERPGLRPVLFPSPYEAACWAVLSQRVRGSQAARIKRRLAEEYGKRVNVGGVALTAFPEPELLAGLCDFPGIPETKFERLCLVAKAAAEGELDAARLRALPVEEALARLRLLPGVGPFSAELILIRGVGHPDVFPASEGRLAEEMRQRYGRPDAGAAELAAIAEAWRPYRSWVSFLLRTAHEKGDTMV
ncbi:DNA-3-methyladenine glycosylase family protein [Amycolatopsis sp. NPDC059027]|uniref:DNA-3-methyladenine glycosylase family protein n=1 Tax=Amycolatopsis sp. NPDC059027 TaxID=3346709 RepID=UPI003670779B